MKPSILIAALACLCICSCNYTSEKTTSPDGTITERTTKTIDAKAFSAGAKAATVLAAPRAVRREK